MSTLQSFLIAREKGSIRTCKINEYKLIITPIEALE